MPFAQSASLALDQRRLEALEWRPPFVLPHQSLAACCGHEREPAGDVPDVRMFEAGGIEDAGRDESAFECRRSGLARFPAAAARYRPRHTRQPPSDRRIVARRHLVVVEAKLAAGAGVIDAR